MRNCFLRRNLDTGVCADTWYTEVLFHISREPKLRLFSCRLTAWVGKGTTLHGIHTGTSRGHLKGRLIGKGLQTAPYMPSVGMTATPATSADSHQHQHYSTTTQHPPRCVHSSGTRGVREARREVTVDQPATATDTRRLRSCRHRCTNRHHLSSMVG